MAGFGAQVSSLLDAFVDGIAPLAGRFAGRRRLVAVEDADGLVFHGVDGSRVTTLGRAGDERIERSLRRYAGSPVELRLRPDRLIRRQLQLPAAGRDFLDPIVAHRLERLTPWKPERVLYGFAVAGEAAADGSLAVDLIATADDIVATVAGPLIAVGLAASAVGSADEPLDQPLRIDLYRGTRDVGRARLKRASAFGLALTALVLVPAAAASVWLQMGADARLADLEGRLATKRAVIQAATGTGDAESRDLRLIGAKRPETAVVVVIDKLARAIPDDTYVKELEIDRETVRVAGLSGNAAALIGELEADEAFSRVRFGAPVTRDESGRDSFDLSLVVDALTPPPAAEVQP